MLGTYMEYPKIMVPKPSHQGGVLDQANKFQYNRVIWDPQKSTFQPKF